MRSRKLLGRKFQSIMHRPLRRKKEARELKKSLLFSAERKPFRGGPSTSSGPKYGGGQYRSPLAGLYDSRYERETSHGQPSQEVIQSSQVFNPIHTRKVKFTSKRPTDKEGEGFGREKTHTRGSNSARNHKLRFRGSCPGDRISKPRGKVSEIPNKLLKDNSGPTILKYISGVELEFDRTPIQKQGIKNPHFSVLERENIDLEIGKLLEKGAIEEVSPEEGQFVGHLFLREKKSEGSVPYST